MIAVVTACGGSVSTVPAASEPRSPDGGTPEAGACSTLPIEATRACVPGTAIANQPITVGIDDRSGCLACFTTIDACNVSIAGNTITLGMMATQCLPDGDRACPAICGIPSTQCTLPPLAPGKYIVTVTGEGTRAGLPPRELVVATTGETSCSLANATTELEDTKYGTSCSTDDDCRSATFGDLCRPCLCPNGAIANTSSDAYDADSRAHRSQCLGTADGVACAACAPMKAKCKTSNNSTGSCKLVAGF